MVPPRDALLDGSKILGQKLVPKGFEFRFLAEGNGSGGNFAAGEFVRSDRRVELHFRYSLGLVRHHLGAHSASHEAYTRELGVWSEWRCPNFSDFPIDAFKALAHDLGFAEDFLTGSAAILLKASVTEKALERNQYEKLTAGNVGDTHRLEEMRRSFYEGRNEDVVALAKSLKYPAQATESQRKMMEIARMRARVHWWNMIPFLRRAKDV